MPVQSFPRILVLSKYGERLSLHLNLLEMSKLLSEIVTLPEVLHLSH